MYTYAPNSVNFILSNFGKTHKACADDRVCMHIAQYYICEQLFVGHFQVNSRDKNFS